MVTTADASRLLSAMLLGIESQVRKLHRFGMAKDAEETAVVFDVRGNHADDRPSKRLFDAKNIS